MAWRAKSLKIVEIEGLVGRIAHRRYVIDFQPAARAALDALEAVAAQRLQAKGFPARRPGYMLGVSMEFRGERGMLKYIVIIVGALLRIATFAVGAYLVFYGVELLVTGSAETIPFVSITPDGIEGRELPIAAFICVVGLILIGLALLTKGKVRDHTGSAIHDEIRWP